MKLVVGLGNPGEEYENTRHNVGFLVVEQLQNKILNSKSENQNNFQNSKFQFSKRIVAEVCDLGNLKLVKPQTFMNRSGVAVRRLVDFYKIKQHNSTTEKQYQNVWVVHDDLDIEWGKYKIDFGKGPKVHRGVDSVEEQLGTDQFWRVRVGVDSRHRQIQNQNSKILNNIQLDNVKNSKQNWIPGEKYVLMKLSEEERAELGRVVDKVVEELRARVLE